MKFLFSEHKCNFCGKTWLVAADNEMAYVVQNAIDRASLVNHLIDCEEQFQIIKDAETHVGEVYGD